MIDASMSVGPVGFSSFFSKTFPCRLLPPFLIEIHFVQYFLCVIDVEGFVHNNKISSSSPNLCIQSPSPDSQIPGVCRPECVKKVPRYSQHRILYR